MGGTRRTSNLDQTTTTKLVFGVGKMQNEVKRMQGEMLQDHTKMS
jgi:hypothetical protein